MAFLRALREAAATDDRVFLLVGDLGYSVVEPFAQEFPNRFLNIGVAEQNLAGMRPSRNLGSIHERGSTPIVRTAHDWEGM